MRDPFRPNSDSQLIREAQIAFVVIMVLVGVLVYVAYHRVAGKKFHFRQMAKAAPLAQHINDTNYPAQAILDHEERVAHEKLSTTDSVAQPSETNQSKPANKPVSTRSFSPSPKPPAPAIQTQPAAPSVRAATAPVIAIPRVAQAQFIEPPKSKLVFDPAPKKHFAVSKPAVNKPLEKIIDKSSKPEHTLTPAPSDKKNDHNLDFNNPKPPAPNDSTAGFRPPKIRSNFGAGSIRELPSFDTSIKKEPIEEAATPLPPLPKLKQSTVSSFVPPQKTTPKKTAPTFAPISNSSEISQAKVAKKQVPKTKPQTLAPQEYRVQTADSLWSIAMDHYGDGRFFRALHEHNLGRIASADRLEPNTAIVVPDVDDLLKRYPELCPADKLSDKAVGSVTQNAAYDQYEKKMDRRFHVTQNGDTLFDVARERLGQASRYLEIFELNEFRIPQHANHLTPLAPGLRLLLPE